MITKKYQLIFFIASIIIQSIALVLLATSAEFIVRSVIPGMDLPWGNLLTGLLFTLFPVNFLVIRRQSSIHPIPKRVYYLCIYAGIVFGFLWLFVSYFLSGNWSATFHGEDVASAVWKYYTYLTPLLPFIGYFLMRMLMIFFKQAPKKQRQP